MLPWRSVVWSNFDGALHNLIMLIQKDLTLKYIYQIKIEHAVDIYENTIFMIYIYMHIINTYLSYIHIYIYMRKATGVVENFGFHVLALAYSVTLTTLCRIYIYIYMVVFDVDV